MKRILVFRLSSIGDIVLTSPILRCLKKDYPEAKIHFATKKIYAQVVASNPHIDHFHFFEENWEEFAATFDDYQFDLYIDLHKNLRSKRLKRQLNFSTYYTYNKRNIDKWLLVNFKKNNLKEYSVVDSYFDVLPIANDGLGLDYYYDEKSVSIEIKKELSTQPYIALVLAAKLATKRTPVLKIIDLVDQLDVHVILLGGKTEESYAAELMKGTQNKKCINKCGQLNLSESAHAVKMANKVISHDTGLMHIAAAFNKDMAVIWGSTAPAFGFAPYYKTDSKANILQLENNHISCRPCSKIGFDKCPKKHFKCINDLDFGVLVDWVRNS